MEYMVAAYTDKGIQKGTNQDSFCVRRAMVSDVGEMVMVVVCDGMGGLKKGEVASAAGITAFGKWFDRNLSQLPSICGTDFSLVRKQWEALIELLHQDLLQYASENQVQIGTTLTAMLAYGDRYLTVNVGDSRIYERKKALRQLTQDQSLVAREVASGRITEDESRHHPQRNVLLQCLGTGTGVSPVFTEGKVQHEAIYLLCTDGLVHEISAEELTDKLQPAYLNSKDDLTRSLSEMTELCKQRGETDNITSVLLKTKESSYKEVRQNVFKKILGKLRSDNTVPKIGAALIETAQIVHTQEVIGQNNTEQTR